MGKKILNSKILYVLLSIVVSVGLWLYVTATDTTPHTQTIHNIPVNFTGVGILENRGLMLVGERYYAQVTVQATNRVLATLTNRTVQVTADVSGIAEEGTHTLSYAVTLPAGVDQSHVTIVSGVNGNVLDVEVARFISREIEIRGEFNGTVAEGYLAGDDEDFMFSPDHIVISGRQELVNQVEYARVTVGGDSLTESVSGEYGYDLIDPSGDILSTSDLLRDVDTVHTFFPIQATAEIPLAVSFTDGGGVSAETATAKLSVDSIRVAGTTEAVEAVKAAGTISLATIDLAAVSDGEELTYPVPLADELTNITGVDKVKVKVSFNKQLVEQTFDVTNITCINVPEGWTADVITQMLSVTVRGSAAQVEALTVDSFRAVADLQSLTPAAGQYTATVYVYLDSVPSAAEVGVLAGDYRIAVNLVEAGE